MSFEFYEQFKHKNDKELRYVKSARSLIIKIEILKFRQLI